MSVPRSVPARHGIAWIRSAFNTLRAHPGPITGAVSWLILAVMVPVGIQIIAELKLPAGSTAFFAAQAISSLVMVLVSSVLIAGGLRTIDTVARGGAARATAVFDVLSDPGLVTRAILFALMVLGITIALMVTVLTALGPDMLAWYAKAATQSMGSPALATPPVARSAWLPVLLGFAGIVVISGLNTFGYAQVALGRKGAGAAFASGLQATSRNIPAILVNMILTVVLLVALSIPAVLLIMLFTFIGALVHQVVATLLLVALVLMALVALYALMFCIMYHAWRDVFGDPEVPVEPGDARIESNPGEFSA